MAGLTVTVSAPDTQTPFGSVAIGPLTVSGTIVPVVLGPTIVNGANTIAVPSNTTGFVFVPPSANTFTLQLKGITGDTGLSMPKTSFSVHLFDTASLPANIVITAGGAVGLSQLVFF